MKRYHYKITPEKFKSDKLKAFNNTINSLDFKITTHSLQRVNESLTIGKLETLLLFIKNLKLDYKNIIEYYTEGSEVIKALYRISYSEYNDIILVISKGKAIITLFFNSVSDLHYTLNKSLYNTK